MNLRTLPVFKTPAGSNYFFGYYDKSPLDMRSKRMLALRVGFIDRLPRADDIAEIGYFEIGQGNSFRCITTTNVFNWQQGAMLQWLGPDFDREIIFNRRTKDGFKAFVYDIEKETEYELPMSIYASNSRGDLALTIDFERHYWCRRGYSYDGIINSSKNASLVSGDGIWLVNLHGKTSKKIIDVESLTHISPLASMKGAVHYVEHMMFSPNGYRFAFYHRWKLEEGGIYTRLYVADMNGGAPQLVHDTGRLSHYCWVNDQNILAIGAEKSSLASSLRKSKFLARSISPLLPIYRSLVKGNSTHGQTKTSSIITVDTYFLVDVTTM